MSVIYGLGGLILVLFISIVGVEFSIGGIWDYNLDLFLEGFTKWFFMLNTSLAVALLIPLLIIKLAHLWKNKDNNAGFILAFIAGIILTVPFIEGFTNQLTHPYRYVTLIIFAGGALGLILSKFLTPKNINA